MVPHALARPIQRPAHSARWGEHAQEVCDEVRPRPDAEKKQQRSKQAGDDLRRPAVGRHRRTDDKVLMEQACRSHREKKNAAAQQARCHNLNRRNGERRDDPHWPLPGNHEHLAAASPMVRGAWSSRSRPSPGAAYRLELPQAGRCHRVSCGPTAPARRLLRETHWQICAIRLAVLALLATIVTLADRTPIGRNGGTPCASGDDWCTV